MAELKKVLGYKTILLITINSIIGSGLFILPALGAKESGTASLISWVILAIISIYVSMAFAELVGLFPKNGGIYEFAKQAYGSFPSFIIGWASWIVGNITTAMLIVGAILYLVPGNGTITIFGVKTTLNIVKLILCIIWVIIFNYMTYRGVKTSSVMLVTFSLITLSIIGLILIPSFFYINFQNLSPFFKYDTVFGNISSIFITIFLISETFFGIESICFLAGETKNAKEILPKALINATLIITTLTIILIAVSFMVIPAGIFGLENAPFVKLVSITLGSWGVNIIQIGTYVVILGAAAGWVVTSPRLISALAEDKMFIPSFSKLHPKYGSPYRAVIFQCIMTIFFVIISFSRDDGYEVLVKLLTPIVLLLMAAIILIVPILRRKLPHAKRSYKLKFAYMGPIIIVLFYVFLIIMWLLIEEGAYSLFKSAIWIIFTGIPIFFLLTVYYNPDGIRLIADKTAKLNLLVENFNLPKRIRKEVLKILGDIEGKNILEHGCGVGTMTLTLSEQVGPNGRIFATNISKGEISVLQTRLNKNEIFNVYAIHDEHHSSRIHPKIPNVDIVVSVGSLSYIQDIHTIASQMYKKLPMGGKICFIEYVDLYKILPNAGWLNDPEGIKEIFRANGFLVRVVKLKGALWNYLFIYGVKSKRSSLPYI